MSSFKRELINNFQQSALNGTPKLSLIQQFKKLYNLTDDEIDWILEASEFNKAPKEIDYSKFYNSVITKNAQRIENNDAQVYYISNFLTKVDCQLLSAYIEQQATPVLSHTSGTDNDERTRQEDVRNSSTAIIDHRAHEFFLCIDRQITDVIGLPPFSAEAMNGQKYKIGEYYKKHVDYFPEKDLDIYGEWMGQRTWTTMLYLNDVEEGGETQFEQLNIKVKPKEGTLLAWNNLNYDGTPNIKTIHEALPPKSGEKYIITKLWRSWNLY
tara:strand:+ start:96 stop:902 length:807 start_codon:yes stop_codon:yes gene_type:complete